TLKPPKGPLLSSSAASKAGRPAVRLRVAPAPVRRKLRRVISLPGCLAIAAHLRIQDEESVQNVVLAYHGACGVSRPATGRSRLGFVGQVCNLPNSSGKLQTCPTKRRRHQGTVVTKSPR